MDSDEHTYAELVPLTVREDDVDVGEPWEVEARDGPALKPVKEDPPRDLRSYLKPKLLFDEPDDPPIIEVVQPDDPFVAGKEQPREEIAEPSTRTQNKQQKRKLSPPKKRLDPKSPERTVPCESCDRKFVTLSHMKLHALAHSKKRNKSCRLCPRKFANQGALANHMRTHEKYESRREK